MKKFVLTLVVLALSAGPALGQTGAPSIAADQAGTQCNVPVPLGTLFNVYVVHKSPGGSTASQWKFTPPSPPGLSFFGGQVAPGFLSIGDVQNGISISYAGCVSGDFLIVTLSFFATQAVPNCTYLEIIPDPTALAGGVVSVTCGFVEEVVNPGEGIMNPDASCDCNVATETATWSRVKALYR